MTTKVLNALPGVLTVFIFGLLVGGRMGAGLPLFWVILGCAVLLIATGVWRMLSNKSSKAHVTSQP